MPGLWIKLLDDFQFQSQKCKWKPKIDPALKKKLGLDLLKDVFIYLEYMILKYNLMNLCVN